MRSQARPLPPTRSGTAPLVLSAIWPGLGHLYLRRRRSAAWLALPSLVLLAPFLLAALRGLEGLIAYLVVPRNSIVLVVAIVVSMASRLLALGDIAVRFRVPRAPANRTLALGLTGVIIVTHVFAAYGVSSVYTFSSRVFGGGSGAPPVGSDAPGAPGVIGPLPAPLETPTDNRRLTALLIGSDYGTGYRHSLTDTMMVVSVDLDARAVVMVSLPRDLAQFELDDGVIYPDKLNSLMARSEGDPAGYPDGGPATLARAIGHLVGIPIHYIAYMDLAGFIELVDTVGGVDIDVATGINDPEYQFADGTRGFVLKAGRHHLDSRAAMAFVRSRYGPGNNDFARARRQQELLLALKAKLTDPSMIPRLPAILDSFSRIIATNFPADRVGEVLEAAKQIPAESVTRYVLGPPYATRPQSSSSYILVPNLDVVGAWSVRVFGSESRYATGP